MSAGKRSYGSGRVYVRTDRAGVETYYGSWWVDGQRVNRKLGVKRAKGSRQGLTAAQAEARLRRLIADCKPARVQGDRVSVEDAACAYIERGRRRGRKPSTLKNIDSEVRIHIAPFFNGRSIDAIRYEDVNDLVGALERKGLAPKSIRNVIATLSAICNFAKAPQRGWATQNPCEGVELPAVPAHSEIRYLTLEQVDELIANLPASPFLEIDRVLFLAAALTGLRKGELVALRWQDVDWEAGRIRVRRNYTRGEFGTPKSRRSTRTVPLVARLAAALELLRSRSAWSAPGDLVFAHPASGEVLAKSNISRRMRAALRAAGLEDSHRFHDLRHTFGTHAAAAGVPIRTLQEWMGHAAHTTTLIYADYAPAAHEGEMIERAFLR